MAGGLNGGNFINSKEVITAIKLTAFERKQIPAPNFCNTIPDNAGPIKKAKLTMAELSANALGKSSLSLTISCTIGCHAGTSKALITPSITLKKRISQTV